MVKRKIMSSTIFLTLTLGLITTGFINFKINNNEVSEAKAEEEKVEYIYLDCSAVAASHSFFHPYVYFGGGGYADDYMLKSVKNNVYKYPIPEGATTVNFEDHYGNGQVKSELWYDGHNWSIDIPETKRTFYVTRYESLGTISEPDAFFGEWRNNYDMPDEEGYYVVNSSNDYKYADAIKMDEGEYGDLAKIIQINAKSNQYLKVRSWFNNTDTTYPSSGKGYKPNDDKDVNVYISENNEFLVEDYVIPPEEDGYYLFGTFNSLTIDEYNSEYKTTTFVDESYDYIEVYDNLALEENDCISIKQHSSSTHPRDKYITPSPSISKTYFEVNGNTVRNKYEYGTAHYDIFIIQTDDGTYFLPKFHEDKVINKITAVFFDVNGVKTGTQDLPDQRSYGYYSPAIPHVDGKYCLGKAYKDEDCTQEYDRHYVSSSENIYIKYFNPGYYLLPMIEDSTGYTTIYKSIYEAGIKMDTTNLEEGSVAEITIRPMHEEEGGPYEFAFLYFGEDGKISSYEYNVMWDDYATRSDFSSYWSVNVRYGNRGKYYRAYIKYDEKNKEDRVFLKDAGSEFCSGFMTNIGSICDSSGVNTDIEALKNEWANQKVAFQDVEYKGEIMRTGFQHFENPQNIYEEMMNKYYYIIYKYGSEEFENFIFTDADPVPPHNNDSNNAIAYETNHDNTVVTIVLIASSVMAISLLAINVFKKRKNNN